jgi:hypothetical protein
MALCPCGCALEVPPDRYFARDKCAARVRKRRERAKQGPTGLEMHFCAVCERPLVRGPLERRKLYHDECRPEAQKILRVLRGK